MFNLRNDESLNAGFELMEKNEALQEEPYLGCFWYDPENTELYGVGKSPANELAFYHSKDWDKDIRTSHQLHKNIWEKQYYRGKDKRFTGDYTKRPRGRVFEIKNEGYVVCVGDWYENHPEAKEEIMFEFQLPEDKTKFIHDELWDIGHGWSNDYIDEQTISY